MVEVEPGGDKARLAPYAAPGDLGARFDAVCGREGWSFTLAPLGQGAVVANLTLLGVTRAGVVSVTQPAERSADLALSVCAAAFGLGLPYVLEDPSYWVDYDPEAREPLYLPDPVPLSAAAATGAFGGATPSAAAPAQPAAAGPAATDQGPARTAGGTPITAGHEVIERLLERLKEEGLGKEAARLVVRYNGYGRTPEESRELYGRLRALLLQNGAEL